MHPSNLHSWCAALVASHVWHHRYYNQQWEKGQQPSVHDNIYTLGQNQWVLIKSGFVSSLLTRKPTRKTFLMFRIIATDGRPSGAVGRLVLKLHTYPLQWKAWSFLPTNTILSTDFVAWILHCVGWRKTAAQEEKDETEIEDESCIQVEAAEETFSHILPHFLAMWPPRPKEFITIALRMCAWQCLHVKTVIVAKCLFPSGKKRKRKKL